MSTATAPKHPAENPHPSPELVPQPSPKKDVKVDPAHAEHTEVRNRFTTMNNLVQDLAASIKNKTTEIRRANGVNLPKVSQLTSEIDDLMDDLVVKANTAQSGH